MTQKWQDVLNSRRGLILPGLMATCDGVMKGGVRRDRVTKRGEMTSDAGRMSITALISTPDEDRSEDIVEPTGVALERYAVNPVVFFDHGQEFTLPIAKSEDGAGNLTVDVSQAGVSATALFSQSLPLAAQVFALWDEGILNATSVNFIPTAATVRQGTGSRDRPGLHVTEWELLEWSVVGIPDNPFAVAKALDRGKLDGRAIEEPLLQMLKNFAPKPRAYGKGFEKPRGAPFHTGTGGIPKPLPTDAGPESKSDDDSDSDSIEDSLPDGHRALNEIHSLAKGLCKKIERESKVVDHPDVLNFLKAASPTAKGFADLVSKARKAIYKDDGDDDSEEKAATAALTDVTKQFSALARVLLADVKNKCA